MLNRAVFSDNGVLSDKTAALDDYYSGSVALSTVAAEDKLYLGSKYPLSRKYFKISSANVGAAVLAVRYWDGAQWRAAATIDDGTASAGVALAVSGYVAWETDKRYPWQADDTTQNDAERITGFGTTNYQNLYWVELRWSGNVAATLTWFGDLFCTDNDLGSEYPDLNRSAVKTAFAAGKTDWEEQRIAACRVVAGDLRSKLIASDTSLVDAGSLRAAAIAKTAELIFRGLGQGYADSKADAAKEYDKRMDRKALVQDANRDGRVDTAEANTPRVTRLER